jgi:hypothetical protein
MDLGGRALVYIAIIIVINVSQSSFCFCYTSHDPHQYCFHASCHFHIMISIPPCIIYHISVCILCHTTRYYGSNTSNGTFGLLLKQGNIYFAEVLESETKQ